MPCLSSHTARSRFVKLRDRSAYLLASLKGRSLRSWSSRRGGTALRRRWRCLPTREHGETGHSTQVSDRVKYPAAHTQVDLQGWTTRVRSSRSCLCSHQPARPIKSELQFGADYRESVQASGTDAPDLHWPFSEQSASFSHVTLPATARGELDNRTSSSEPQSSSSIVLAQ